MHLGELAGWASVALGQLVSWPQVLKLRRERGDGVSLASYAIVTVSMSLFFLHAVAIGDAVSMASVPVSMVPNVLIAVTLVRRRRLTGPVPVGSGLRSEASSLRSSPNSSTSSRSGSRSSGSGASSRCAAAARPHPRGSSVSTRSSQESA